MNIRLQVIQAFLIIRFQSIPSTPRFETLRERNATFDLRIIFAKEFPAKFSVSKAKLKLTFITKNRDKGLTLLHEFIFTPTETLFALLTKRRRPQQPLDRETRSQSKSHPRKKWKETTIIHK